MVFEPMVKNIATEMEEFGTKKIIYQEIHVTKASSYSREVVGR